jgi:hypothetical protein
MILYIIIKLYYILNKKEDFISINEYQENQEKKEKIKSIFNSVVIINLSFIIYFLITYTPSNICMLFKYSFFYSNINTYLIDFITIFLISISGIFIYCLKLLDPFMRTIIINLLLLNWEFISNYKEKLRQQKSLYEPFNTDNFSDIYNIYEDNFADNKLKEIRHLRKTKTTKINAISFNFRKNNNEKNEMSEENKDGKDNKFGISTIKAEKANSSQHIELNNLDSDNNTSINEIDENYYEEKQENEENKKNEEKDNKEKEKNKIKNEIN